MATEQTTVTHAIAQAAADAMKAAVHVMAVAVGESNSGARSRPINVGPTLGRPTL